MPVYLPFDFTGGINLGVLRPIGAGFDKFGDPVGGEWVIHHYIGPCNVPVKAMRARARTGTESRARAIWDINAPVGSDVLKSDRIAFPAGFFGTGTLILPVVTEPEYPRNPWTAWQPYIHFQLEEVG